MSLRYIFSGLVWMVFGLAMALSKSAQAQGLDEGASFSMAGTGSLILNSGSISDIAPVGIEGFSGGSLSLSSYGDYSGWTSIINGTTFGGTLEVTGGTINNTGNRLTISGSNVTLTYNPTNLSSDNVFSGLV